MRIPRLAPWTGLLLLLLAACARADGPGAARAGAGSPAGDSASGGAARYVPAEEAVWTEVRSWRGTGSRTTQQFQVRGDEWRIVLTAAEAERPEYSSLGVNVHSREKEYLSRANLRGVGTDTSYVYAPPGFYYLEISSNANRWEVRVEDRSLPAERPVPR